MTFTIVSYIRYEFYYYYPRHQNSTKLVISNVFGYLAPQDLLFLLPTENCFLVPLSLLSLLKVSLSYYDSSGFLLFRITSPQGLLLYYDSGQTSSTLRSMTS